MIRSLLRWLGGVKPGAASPGLLNEASRELEHAKHVVVLFPESPTELERRDGLLRRLRNAGLADTLTVKRLEFLQRLRRGLATAIEDENIPAFLTEAKALDLEDYAGVQVLQRHQRILALRAEGPQIIEQAGGRGVYWRGDAEYRRSDGAFEVTTEGVTYAGDVLVSIPWGKVVHVAHVTTDDGSDVIAIQEHGRRTASKFGVPGADSAYACELAVAVWNRHRSTTATPPTEVSAATCIDVGTPGGDCDFHIVGESNYQPELRNVSRSGREFSARLEHEPTNRFDPNAVRVCSPRGRTIGYLSREHALDYHTVFGLLAQHGCVGQCRAKLIGGIGEKKSFGVLLNLADPESLLLRIRDAVAPGTAAPTGVQPF